jgi:hypothetical protein
MDFSDTNMTYGYVIWGGGHVWAVDLDMIPVFTARPVIDGPNIFNRVKWDKFERKVYIISGNVAQGRTYLTKLSEDLQTVHWSIFRDNIKAFMCIDIHQQTGALYAISKDFAGLWRVHEIDKADGSYLNNGSDGWEVLGSGSWIWADMVIYPNSMFALVSFVGGGGTAGGIARVPLTPAPTGSPPTLKDVVEDISVRTGLTLSDINAAALSTDFVSGYALAQRMPARQAIEPLMRGYFFDAVESDFVAKFVKRGGASLKTISSQDLGARDTGAQVGPQLEQTRIEENELPYQVDVNYLDAASFYKVNVQYDRRLIGGSKVTIPVNIPVVFTSTQAKRIASALLYNAWVERQTALCKTTRKYLDLDPSDVITVVTSPNLPLLDDFDRPNEAPAVGWQAVAMDGEGADGLDVQGGALRAVPKDFAALMYPVPFYPDIDIEVTVGFVDIDTNSGFGLAARFSMKNPTLWDNGSDSTHIELEFDNYLDAGVTKGYVVIWQCVTGTWSQLLNVLNLARFKYGDRIRMSARGALVYAYVNDVRVGVSTATTVLTGDYVGLVAWENETEIREVRVGPASLNTTRDYRITKAEYTAPNQYDLTLVEEDTSAYSQFGTGVDNELPSQETPALVPTLLLLMDTSIMGRESDSSAGFYVAATPSFGASWPGAGVYRSDDSGASYNPVTTLTNAATVGNAQATLGYEGAIP